MSWCLCLSIIMLISIQLQVLVILLAGPAENLPNRSLVDPKTIALIDFWSLLMTFEETMHQNFEHPRWRETSPTFHGRANLYQTDAKRFVSLGPRPWDSKRVHHHEATWAWGSESGDFGMAKVWKVKQMEGERKDDWYDSISDVWSLDLNL